MRAVRLGVEVAIVQKSHTTIHLFFKKSRVRYSRMVVQTLDSLHSEASSLDSDATKSNRALFEKELYCGMALGLFVGYEGCRALLLTKREET